MTAQTSLALALALTGSLAASTAMAQPLPPVPANPVMPAVPATPVIQPLPPMPALPLIPDFVAPMIDIENITAAAANGQKYAAMAQKYAAMVDSMRFSDRSFE